MAIDAMRKAYASDEVREMIESRMKAIRDWNTREANAIEQGLAKGLAQGLAEGKAEVARKLKEKGMDNAAILEITGVDPDLL